ncbi:MAG: hypothetical protein EBT26_04360 [Microbacteriaceae bacterium]|nr:hypothetical protein [Microbacteriaceae bacterium]NBS61265.1 hypothetical protein [Microbacteriaceae bacterium]
METLNFIFGVLITVLVAIAAIAVYSTVKILKLQKQSETMDRYNNDQFSNLHRNVGHEFEELRRQLHNEIRNVNEAMERNDEAMWRRTDELNSYVDRRFDKLIDTYMLVKETEQESKKIIKG